jgi:amidase
MARIKIDDTLNAFCKDTGVYLEGASDAPLTSLTFAAKDILDVAGYVTGGSNPDWKAAHEPATPTAWAVNTLVEAGATMVGKTITDELTRGIFGENAHYGTPVNPRAPDRVPGGSVGRQR